MKNLTKQDLLNSNIQTNSKKSFFKDHPFIFNDQILKVKNSHKNINENPLLNNEQNKDNVISAYTSNNIQNSFNNLNKLKKNNSDVNKISNEKIIIDKNNFSNLNKNKFFL